MPPQSEEMSSVQSPLQFLISAGGLPLLALGLVFFIWGMINLRSRTKVGAILLQSLFSLIPGILALVGIYMACIEFTEFASAEIPPKPAVFAAATGRAMSYGFFGLVSTMMPVTLGLCAFGNHCRRNQAAPSESMRS